MDTLTYTSLAERLKNAPYNVLERVAGYLDAILEDKFPGEFILSKEQKKILDSQDNITIDECTEAEELYHKLKKEHGL